MLPTKEIVGIQFGLHSSKDIKARSDVTVSSTTLHRRAATIKNSVVDSALGSITSDTLCGTCAHTAERCNGHSGHIPLPHPVFNGEMIQIIQRVLESVCVNCSAVLLSKKHAKYKKILTLDPEERIAVLAKASVRIKRCGEFDLAEKTVKFDDLEFEDIEKLGFCGAHQPSRWAKFEHVLLRPVYEVDVLPKRVDEFPQISMDDLYMILDGISDDDCAVLGFNATFSHPRNLMFTDFYVMPTTVRPGLSGRSDDDLTLRLRNIVKASVKKSKTEKLSDIQRDIGSNLVVLEHCGETYTDLAKILDDNSKRLTKHVRLHKAVVPVYLDDVFELSRQCAGFQNSKLCPKNDYDFGAELRSIRHRYTATSSKRGRIRNNVTGKRGNFNGRCVISPQTDFDPDQVIVPTSVAKIITIPAIVQQYNIRDTMKRVENGPDVHPGANYVQRGAITYDLRFYENFQLKVGDTVHRHMDTDDQVIINRQPSLHRFSYMCYRAVISPESKTLRIHLAVTGAIAGDFDGDEACIFSLQAVRARAEGQELMAVGRNMVKDSKMMVSFVQHSVVAAYLLMRDGVDVDDMAQLIMASNDEKFVCEMIYPEIPATAKELFQRMFLTSNIPDKVTKSSLNHLMFNYWKRYPDKACHQMGNITRVLEAYLSYNNASMSMDDCILGISDQVQQAITKACDYIDTINHDQTDDYLTETHICDILDGVRDAAGKDAMEKLKGTNGLFVCIDSQAKGGEHNAFQTAGLIGQQRNKHSKRPTKTTAHITDKAAAHGFVKSNFSEGLTAHEFFFHSHAGRRGLINTGSCTSEIGYVHRKLSKGLEDATTYFDKTVRNGYGQIIQFLYGGDGLETTGLFSADIIIPAEGILTPTEHLRIKALHSTIMADMGEIPKEPLKVWTPIKLLITADDSLRKSHQTVELLETVVVATLAELIKDCRVSLKFQLFFLCQINTHTLRGFSQADICDILGDIVSSIRRATIETSTPAGHIAAQSSSEPMTQLNLSSFHKAGAKTTLSTGIPRLKEIINMSKTSTPAMTIVLNDESTNEMQLISTTIQESVAYWGIDNCPDPDRIDMFRVILEREEPEMLLVLFLHDDAPDAKLVADAIMANTTISNKHFDVCEYICFSAVGATKKWVSIDLNSMSSIAMTYAPTEAEPDLKAMVCYDKLMHLVGSQSVCGIPGVIDVSNTENMVHYPSGRRRVVLTRGSDLMACASSSHVDIYKTSTNDISEVYDLFGIDAARQAIYYELTHMMLSSSASVSTRHIQLIADTMCRIGSPCGFTYKGFMDAKTSHLKLATFERVLDGFMKMGRIGHFDPLLGAAEACIVGTEIPLGTGARHQFQLISDKDVWPTPRTIEHNRNIMASLPTPYPNVAHTLSSFTQSEGKIFDIILPAAVAEEQEVPVKKRKRSEDVETKTKAPKKTKSKTARRGAPVIETLERNTSVFGRMYGGPVQCSAASSEPCNGTIYKPTSKMDGSEVKTKDNLFGFILGNVTGRVYIPTLTM